MSIAYESGKVDGREWARDNETQLERGLNNADENLLNACGSELVCRTLGLTLRELKARGAKFEKACTDYNRGWDESLIKHTVLTTLLKMADSPLVDAFELQDAIDSALERDDITSDQHRSIELRIEQEQEFHGTRGA